MEQVSVIVPIKKLVCSFIIVIVHHLPIDRYGIDVATFQRMAVNIIIFFSCRNLFIPLSIIVRIESVGAVRNGYRVSGNLRSLNADHVGIRTFNFRPLAADFTLVYPFCPEINGLAVPHEGFLIAGRKIPPQIIEHHIPVIFTFDSGVLRDVSVNHDSFGTKIRVKTCFQDQRNVA